MNREEAHSGILAVSIVNKIDGLHDMLDKIFDDFEVQLHELKKGKASQLAYNYMLGGDVKQKEFENQTCKDCKYNLRNERCNHNNSMIEFLDIETYDNFSCNHWEKKL